MALTEKGNTEKNSNRRQERKSKKKKELLFELTQTADNYLVANTNEMFFNIFGIKIK